MLGRFNYNGLLYQEYEIYIYKQKYSWTRGNQMSYAHVPRCIKIYIILHMCDVCNEKVEEREKERMGRREHALPIEYYKMSN